MTFKEFINEKKPPSNYPDNRQRPADTGNASIYHQAVPDHPFDETSAFAVVARLIKQNEELLLSDPDQARLNIETERDTWTNLKRNLIRNELIIIRDDPNHIDAETAGKILSIIDPDGGDILVPAST
jgi:hypothetical protein